MAKIERLGKVSAASVAKGTGRDWDAWIAILDRAGGRGLAHRELVALLKRRHRLTPWWQQGVATGYEIHVGRRAEGRNLKGEYSLTATRALPRSRDKLWKFMMSPAGLALWLGPLAPLKLEPRAGFEVAGGVFGEVRTFKKPERLRFTWQDENWEKASVVQVILVKRPGEKSLLGITHEKLASDRLRHELRAHWKAALDRLAAALKSE